jgi:hypothetical protein
MSRSHSAAEINAVADAILDIIGCGSKQCREIAEALGIPDKTTYRHLRYMSEMLGVVAKEKVPAANGGESKVTLWRRGAFDLDEAAPRMESKHITLSDWPRGEHAKRDPLVAALFGLAEQYFVDQRPRDVENSA